MAVLSNNGRLISTLPVSETLESGDEFIIQSSGVTKRISKFSLQSSVVELNPYELEVNFKNEDNKFTGSFSGSHYGDFFGNTSGKALGGIPFSISTGDGLTGGGVLTTNRSLAVDSTVVRTTGNQLIYDFKSFESIATNYLTVVDTTGTQNECSIYVGKTALEYNQRLNVSRMSFYSATGSIFNPASNETAVGVYIPKISLSGSIQGSVYSNKGGALVLYPGTYANDSNVVTDARFYGTSSYANTSLVAVTALNTVNVDLAETSSYSFTASYIGNGTDNYVPKWSSNTLTGTSLIYNGPYNSKNFVGIGATEFWPGYSSGNGPDLYVNSTILVSGSIGIGTTSQYGQFTTWNTNVDPLSDSRGIRFIKYTHLTGENTNALFNTDNLLYVVYDNSNADSIYASGKLGPTAFRSQLILSASQNGTLASSDENISSAILGEVQLRGRITASHLSVFRSYGITMPGGTVTYPYADSSSCKYAIHFYMDPHDKWSLDDHEDQYTYKYGIFQSGSSDRNYFNGNVGCGTTNPTGSLHVVGNARFDDGIVFIESSNGSFTGSLSGSWDRNEGIYVAGPSNVGKVLIDGDKYPYVKLNMAYVGYVTMSLSRGRSCDVFVEGTSKYAGTNQPYIYAISGSTDGLTANTNILWPGGVTGSCYGYTTKSLFSFKNIYGTIIATSYEDLN